MASPAHAGVSPLASRWVLRALAMGIAAGVLAGMFGVGGGIIMVPLLIAWFALDQRRASATSLLAIVPIGIASAYGYAVNGNVAWGAAALLAVGSVLGGQLGAWMLPRTPVRALQLAFGVLSILTAIRLLLETDEVAASAPPEVNAPGGVLLVLVGVAGGVLAGLLGVGGGIIMVPALVILAGADADLARGTSLAVLVVTALTATVANLSRGLVEVRISVLAGLAGVPGGLAGAWLGQELGGEVALTLFAGLLVWSGVRMLRPARARS